MATKKASASPYGKGLVINDLHIPFEDRKAIKLMYAVADDFQPDKIFLDGDIGDFWQISHYVKNPALRSIANLEHEISSIRSFLKDLRKRFPASEIIYLFGNHEYRWDVFLAKHAVELVGLKGLTLEEQLGLAELDITAVNTGRKENSYLWGNLLIGHFDRVAKYSGMTAKALLEDKAISLIQAHVHRGGSSYRRLYDRDIVAFENFCLCSRDPEYVDRPNWQQGFSTVVNNLTRFHVTQHPIITDEDGVYRTWFNGQEYRV